MGTRDGHRWGTQAIHRILTNSAYYGICWWNVDPSEHEFIDFGEPVAIKIPAIISEERFEAVQKVLEARDPEMGAAKADSSPLLLSKIAACKCGASMTLGTGTGKQGNTYRYYRCSADNRGLDRCSGPWIGEKTLDQAVLDVVQKVVLSEDHLQEALKGLQERETSRRAARQESVPHLRMRFEAAEKTWKSLLEMAKLVPGLQNEPMLRAELEQATRELDVSRSLMTEALAPRDEFGLSPKRLSIFASRIRDLLLGDNKGATKVYLSTIVSKVEVGDRFIRVVGEWGDIWAAARDMDSGEGNAVPIHPGVQRFVRRWRRGRNRDRTFSILNV